ncbi:tape measure protein [Paenibacillus mesophilus]|uniref:tape measure protein n=1 Tax=Paenibacillus mesophilus TaxID=2582849 RepID=UPI00110DAA52|nr:tape measure protein [Paenibacillus mesophilus]TMV49359.1 tape measure protein [Paenibacillus mesophilus]
MAGEAVRSLHADIGFMIDDLPLRKLERMLDQLKQHMLGGAAERYEKDLRETGESAKEMASKSGKAAKETKEMGSAADQASEDARELGNEAEKTASRMQRLGSAARSVGNSIGSAFSRLHSYTNGFERLRNESTSAIDSIRRGFLSLGSTALKMPFTLPAVVAGGSLGYGAVSGTKKALTLAGEKENAMLAMSFFGSSEERGQSIYDQLVNFAATTPYGLNFTREQATGLMGMYKGMQGDAFDADKMIGSSMRALRGFGDAAGLTGAGEGGADRALLGFRQIGTVGKLQLEELRQVTENLLIPMELIRKELGLTKEEMASIGDLNIDAEKAMNAILRALEKNFGGGMEKLSKTMLGMTSQLKDTWQLSVTAIGDGMAVPVKRILTDLVGTTDFTSDEFKKFEARLRGFGASIGSVFESLYKEIKVRGSAAFEHIRTNYLDNEKFQKLPFNEKISFVLGDIKSQFDKWYEADGRTMIESGAQKFVDFTIGTIESNLPGITSMGVKIGSSIAQGMISGVTDAARDNPALAALLGFIATPGGIPAKLIGGSVAGGTALIVKGDEKAREFISSGGFQSADVAKQKFEAINGAKAPDWITDVDQLNPASAKYYRNDPRWNGVAAPGDSVETIKSGFQSSGGMKQQISDDQIKGLQNYLGGVVDGSNKNGLSFVPFDGYISELHRGERVLTAEENKRFSKGIFTTFEEPSWPDSENKRHTLGVSDEQIEALNRTERVMAGEDRRQSASPGGSSNAGMGAFSPTIHQNFVVNGGEPGRVEKEARNGTVDAWEEMWRSLGRRNPFATEF